MENQNFSLDKQIKLCYNAYLMNDKYQPRTKEHSMISIDIELLKKLGCTEIIKRLQGDTEKSLEKNQKEPQLVLKSA